MDTNDFISDYHMHLLISYKLLAGIQEINIPYALVVTLGTSGVNIPFYQEVKSMLAVDAARQQVR